MTKINWGNVPQVKLHKTPDDVLHSQDLTCEGATPELLKEAQETTLHHEMVEKDQGVQALERMCPSDQCAPPDTWRENSAASKALRRLKALHEVDHVGRPMETVWTHAGVRDALAGRDVVDYLTGDVPATPMNTYIQETWKRVQVLHEEAMDELRGSTWRTRLVASLLEDAHTYRLSQDLQAAGIGAPSDMGLMVGTPKIRLNFDDHDDDLMVELLKEDIVGPNVVAVMPLAMVRLFFTTNAPIKDGCMGKRRQLMRLPDDATPELLEIVAGVLDTEGDGPLSRLPEALDAARRLLAQRAR